MLKFGQLLLKLRKEKNLTIRALASKLGVTNSYITKLEKGTRLPSADLFLKLSNYFGLHPLNLFEKCNDIPETLKKEVRLKTFGESEYELRMRAAWEVEDPELKKLNLPFDDLLKYVQQKAKSKYHSQQIYRQREGKKYQNVKPKIIKSTCSKRKQHSHRSKEKQNKESDTDGCEPPLIHNYLKSKNLKAKVKHLGLFVSQKT